MVSEQFKKAADIVKKLKSKPNNNELLSLYGLYKQATVGDINISKPGLLGGIEANSKWNAWEKHKGLSNYQAEVDYVKKVNELIKKYGLN
jgi:diazepam-binding inhibitor (GABA receptor modulating acyl-CoA-binding protein)